ncbi:MAG: efflux RND transporter permease subunit [Planctomycetes bacterium]|nr:efflux RND transporter permease subunit [Planctomycetota bacterium]
MWIVQFALRYRYTVAVLAILVLLFGLRAARSMSTDILPRVDAPELMAVWTYPGLDAAEMAAKITSFAEIATLNNVDDLQEVTSETSNGAALVKLRFQPGVDMAMAQAQVASVSQTILRRMPAGATPPLIVRTSPSSVPIVQLVVASDQLTSGQLFDYARLNLRAALQSIPGMRISLPYGGASRQVMVEIDPAALIAHGITAAEVNAAVARQNLTLPSGTLREGARELPIELNASPETIAAFLDLPLRLGGERALRLRDVADVRDGEAVTTNIARLDGQNACLVAILKLGAASTVDIVDGIRARLPEIRASAPPGVSVEPIFDQSVFVRAAVGAVRAEILLVGGLVAFVVLLFLGSWRATLVVLTSIPLALLCSVIGLSLVGATFNLMTLGGLALAIGILVDNALVEIENIERQVGLGKDVHRAILDGAQEVAFPEFVSTLSICIVFLPIFLLQGTAADVFRPLALAVVFAMAASYLLARTLVPSLASVMLPRELQQRAAAAAAGVQPRGLGRVHHALEHGLQRLAGWHGRLLSACWRRRWLLWLPALAVLALGSFAVLRTGREFFPVTDAGLLRLFVRAPSGTRIEDTAARIADVQREIRALIPADELGFVVENLGAPSPVNQAWVETTSITAADGEVLIQLRGEHAPTAQYEQRIRAMLREKFAELRTFFRPADATSQTLAAGAATTFEVRCIGRDVAGNLALLRTLQQRFAAVPGAVDVQLREVLDQPGYALRIDRVRAASFGIDPQAAATTVLAALGSGGSVSPNVWADPRAGTSYDVQILMPPLQLTNLDALLDLRVRPADGSPPVALRAFATAVEKRAPASVSRTTLLPTVSLVANVAGRDLGAVTDELQPLLAEARQQLKPGNRLELRGQAALMLSVFADLLGGLLLAAVLVLLVMVVNYQSWALPFVAISGLPIAVAGALVGLWLTGTWLSVPALTGIIMVVGVSTANSVLVSSFARDRWVAGDTAIEAALAAARTRLRPVLMTALAMVLGVVPMALGHAEGGEQNAPLGRAVIGGLVFGTVASLCVVPVVFALVCQRLRPPASA